jgi:hypothetical protein
MVPADTTGSSRDDREPEVLTPALRSQVHSRTLLHNGVLFMDDQQEFPSPTRSRAPPTARMLALPPGLLTPPDLRPRRDLAPIPQAALSLASDQSGAPATARIIRPC